MIPVAVSEHVPFKPSGLVCVNPCSWPVLGSWPQVRETHKGELNDILLKVGWASQVAQRAKCLPRRPDNLSVIPENHV